MIVDDYEAIAKGLKRLIAENQPVPVEQHEELELDVETSRNIISDEEMDQLMSDCYVGYDI